MNLLINKRKADNLFVYVLLFLCSMNFEAKFHYFVYALFFFLLLLQKSHLITNHKSFAYLGLGVLMALYSIDEGILSMLRCFSPFMMYEVGFNLTVRDHSKIKGEQNGAFLFERFLYTMIAVICAGSFAHFLLNALTNIGDFTGRNTVDVWSDEIMGATGQACLACLMLGLAVALIFRPRKTYQRYLGIACIAASLAYNLVLSGRSIIALIVILFFVSLLYINRIEKSLNKKIAILLKLILGIMSVVLVFSFNLFGVRDFLVGSNFFERFTKVLNFWDNSARDEAKLQFLLNFWKYPLGGLHMFEQYGYAHDLLLDGYDEFGLLGLILLVTIVSMGITSLTRFLKRSKRSYELKFVLLCVYVAVLLIFCIEPILAGMAWLFVIYSFINGFIDGICYADGMNRKGIER